uniref:Glycosyltransferase n=1 Tax=Oryza meridionalis TaxID=40149 RepID=A0A0E0DBV3_9ORYZ
MMLPLLSKCNVEKKISSGEPRLAHTRSLRSDASNMASDGSICIVLFPFLAQGHFSAFLSLAALLHRAQPTADITFVSTPRNVEGLRRRSSSLTQYLRFHALPFTPAEHGLPADVESTDGATIHQLIDLFAATESHSFQESFDGFVGGCTSTAGEADGASVCVVVVADPLLAWTTSVARRHGATHAFFVSCGAFGTAVYHSLWNHLPHLRAPGDDAFCLPDHPEVTVHRSQLPVQLLHADGMDRSSAYHLRQISAAYDTDAVLINTVEELEPAGLRMIRKTMGVPVYPIGPLVRCNHAGDNDDDDINRWLDAQAERSVLYISFGSYNSLRPDQMSDLATALELTGRPFIWAIRPPIRFNTTSGDDICGAAAEWLPEGFEERMRAKNTGLLIHGLAPQVAILAHASTGWNCGAFGRSHCGAFLSHCGWNSVLESTAHGVPVVAWPLNADQFFNAQMMEEWGSCVELCRGNAPDSPVLERERVAEVVEMVMGSMEMAAKTRQRVKKIQEMIAAALEDGGSSTNALESHVRFEQYAGWIFCKKALHFVRNSVEAPR